MIHRLLKLFSLVLFLHSSVVFSEETARENQLDQLLQNIKQSAIENDKANNEREQRFINEKSKRATLLRQAKQELEKQKSRSRSLKQSFHKNEKKLTSLESKLHQRMGSLGELFGVFKQISGDTVGVLEQSMISAQYDSRVADIKNLSKQKALPSIPELETLWFALQQEMTETGKVTQFEDNVLKTDGTEYTAQVTRAGPFTSISDGKFLSYHSQTGKLAELPKQPSSDYLGVIEDFEESSSAYSEMIIDPSRGVLLNLLIQTPGMFERIQQGKLIGYIILALGLVGLLLVIERLIRLTMEEKNIDKQTSLQSADTNNPLGRIMAVYSSNNQTDVETLERKIDEAILKETPKLERGLPIIKILSVIAPLLGLLGTVTGMIETFQSITLFGTGDPKLMAGGISQALVTTVLGLVVAIPLILLHSIANNKSKRCINILEEQSAGLIALKTEEK